MDFEVKGIKFNRNDLIDLELCELRAGSISKHHLFHLFGNSKAVLLLRAGDYIESQFISNYIERGMLKVRALEVVSNLEVEELKTLFLSLKNSSTQKAQHVFRKEFLEIIKIRYKDKESSSFLAVVVFLFDEFYCFPKQILASYQETSSLLFTRALRVSSLGVLSSIINGLTDYKFLKDFYNICFIMDYGLVEYGKFHYTLALACEVERKKPGMGLSYLEKLKRSEGEKKIFINHSKIGVEFAKEHSGLLSNPELIEMINYHHEKVDGSGFPFGIKYSGLSDVEATLTFCDYLTPFSEPIFEKGDLQETLFNSFEELKGFSEEAELPVRELMAKWQGFLNWMELIDLEEDVA